MSSTTGYSHFLGHYLNKETKGVCTARRAEFVIRRPPKWQRQTAKLAKLSSQSRIKDGGNHRLECHTEQKSASGRPRHTAQSSTLH